MFEYYKLIDWSIMERGFTIPQKHIKAFLGGKSVLIGGSREVTILWGKKTYKAKINHINRKNTTPVYQLRWNNKDITEKIRKTFIQSYIILKSQKELFNKENEKGKHFRTNLAGGQQEVLIFRPLSAEKIECEVFIRIENERNTLFERFLDANVFELVFDKSDKQYLIQRSTSWMKAKDFRLHADEQNVIYYLANTKKKLLYIGKAECLGKRVKPGRQHQNMDGDRDLFKYDIIRPEFAHILERIEDHTIRSFASVLQNNKSYNSINISNYTLVNANWKKL